MKVDAYHDRPPRTPPRSRLPPKQTAPAEPVKLSRLLYSGPLQLHTLAGPDCSKMSDKSSISHLSVRSIVSLGKGTNFNKNLWPLRVNAIGKMSRDLFETSCQRKYKKIQTQNVGDSVVVPTENSNYSHRDSNLYLGIRDLKLLQAKTPNITRKWLNPPCIWRLVWKMEKLYLFSETSKGEILSNLEYMDWIQGFLWDFAKGWGKAVSMWVGDRIWMCLYSDLTYILKWGASTVLLLVFFAQEKQI